MADRTLKAINVNVLHTQRCCSLDSTRTSVAGFKLQHTTSLLLPFPYAINPVPIGDAFAVFSC